MSETLPAVPERNGTTALTPARAFAEWPAILRLAEGIHKSRLAPDALKTPEAVAVVILGGHEMGMPPMQSLRLLHVINNKLGLSAEVMRAMVLAVPGNRISVQQTDETRCILQGNRPGQEAMVVEYSMADAKQEGLADRPRWKAGPKDQLYARATSRLARRYWPDVIRGFYTIEELQDIEAQPAPAIAEAAPEAPTRAERAEPPPQSAPDDPAMAQASDEECRKLVEAWLVKNAGKDRVAFEAWAKDMLIGVDISKRNTWTVGILAALREHMEAK